MLHFFALLLIHACHGTETLTTRYAYITNDAKSFADAESYCSTTYGTHLAKITSQAQLDEFTALNPSGDTWIGLDDIDVEGTFEWTDGTSLGSFTPWLSGEPNNSGIGEDCVTYFHGIGTGNQGWNDANCGNTQNFLCARPPTPAPTGLTAVPTDVTPAPTSSPTPDCDNWIYAIAKGTYGTYDIGGILFNQLFQDSTNHIIRRECSSCSTNHQLLYYRRLTSTSTYEPYYHMTDSWRDNNNEQSIDFRLYTTLSDAITGTATGEFGAGTCNFNDPGVGFPRDCGGTGQWNSFYSGAGGQPNVRFSIYSPGDSNCNSQTCFNTFDNCL